MTASVMRKSRTASLNDEGSLGVSGVVSAGASLGCMTSQLTAPSASLCAWSAGAFTSTFLTTKPPSPSSEKGFTTTEMRSAATIVSPSKRSTPTRVRPRSSSEAFGKWRSRLMFSASKSRRARSTAFASRRTISAILPRNRVGAIQIVASRTSRITSGVFSVFFMVKRISLQRYEKSSAEASHRLDYAETTYLGRSQRYE